MLNTIKLFLPEACGDVEGLHHFLNGIPTVSIREAVASKTQPCLADIDPAEVGNSAKIWSHFDTCDSFVSICLSKAQNSSIFKLVEQKLRELFARNIANNPYNGLTAGDMISAMLIYSAETPIAFYKMIVAPFNIRSNILYIERI